MLKSIVDVMSAANQRVWGWVPQRQRQKAKKLLVLPQLGGGARHRDTREAKGAKLLLLLLGRADPRHLRLCEGWESARDADSLLWVI